MDSDDDGDLDIVIGNADGTLQFFENTGTANAPVYTEVIGSGPALTLAGGGTPSDSDSNGSNDLYTETLGDLTMTASMDGNGSWTSASVGTYGGLSGNAFYFNGGSVSTVSTVSVGFSRAVNLTSFVYAEADGDNIGTQTARSSANWNVYYIYYNAYDVNDYGVVFFDEFNTSIPQNTYDCPDLNNCVINVDIPSGSDFAWQAFGDYAITRTYKMPQITGEYYLMLFVDGGEAFRETNEWNNLFYTTEYPIFFLNGYGAKGQDSPGLRSGKDVAFKNSLEPAPENLAGSMYNTAVKEDNRNAYTPKELIQFFNAKSESGELRKKAYLLGDNDKQVFVKKQDQ